MWEALRKQWFSPGGGFFCSCPLECEALLWLLVVTVRSASGQRCCNKCPAACRALAVTCLVWGVRPWVHKGIRCKPDSELGGQGYTVLSTGNSCCVAWIRYHIWKITPSPPAQHCLNFYCCVVWLTVVLAWSTNPNASSVHKVLYEDSCHQCQWLPVHIFGSWWLMLCVCCSVHRWQSLLSPLYSQWWTESGES